MQQLLLPPRGTKYIPIMLISDVVFLSVTAPAFLCSSE